MPAPRAAARLSLAHGHPSVLRIAHPEPCHVTPISVSSPGAAARPLRRSPPQAQTLRVGLAEDPDVLDPTLARTFVGRIVFAALCDKLFDIDEKLNIVPQLATGYEWSADSKALTMKLRPGVTFHDGEKLDAAAVKFNLERHKTMPGSNRRGELAPVASVDVVDPTTVRLNLVGAVLAAAGGAGRPRRHDGVAEGGAGRGRTTSAPSRSARGRSSSSSGSRRTASCSSATPATGTRTTIHFDKVIYTPIADATVRLANLRVGPVRLHRARRVVRHREAEERQEAEDRAHHRDRLPGHHDQRRQEREGAEEPARQGRRACARRSSSRSTARAWSQVVMDNEAHGRQPVGRAEQPVLREERAGAQARRRARQGAAQGGRRRPTRASR